MLADNSSKGLTSDTAGMSLCRAHYETANNSSFSFVSCISVMVASADIRQAEVRGGGGRSEV